MAETTISTDNDVSLNGLADRASRGETVVLTKKGQIIARVVPVPQIGKKGRELARLWPSLRHLDPLEAETFAADIEQARRQLPPLTSGWES